MLNVDVVLENRRFRIEPLKIEHKDSLVVAANDKKIWEQHPDKDRWKPEVFSEYFDTILALGGGFAIIDKFAHGLGLIGMTRFYAHADYNPEEDINPKNHQDWAIGFTFIQRKYWGNGVNEIIKHMMLDYAFKTVESIWIDADPQNTRSLKAIKNLGCEAVYEDEFDYFGTGKPQFFVCHLMSKTMLSDKKKKMPKPYWE